MTKKEAINKINNTLYFNDDQKTFSIKIINSIHCGEDVQDYYDFVMTRQDVGFKFDLAPDPAIGRIAVINEMENYNININPKKIELNENKLIIGDNYEALKNLLLTHKEKIDIIYIDPPYNTEKAKTDGNASSKEGVSSKFLYKNKFGRNGWLNMLRSRIQFAKNLLASDGVIFVSIDDSEQAYLKVLMDNIFGENNFISNLPRATNKGGKNSEKFLKLNHDYILIYAKNKQNIYNFLKEKHSGLNYKYKDDKYGNYALKEIDAPKGLGYLKSLDFEVEFQGKKYIPINGKGIRNRWKWSKKKFEIYKTLGLLTAKDGRLYYKMFLDYAVEGNKLVKKQREIAFSSLKYTTNEFLNTIGTKELKTILNSKHDFDYPKPVSLIKDLIKLVTKPSALVLDFYAGSGTTGHAVLQLNREDGGNRKFILVTNNESNIGLGITYKMLYTIIKGQSISDNGNTTNEWVKNNNPFLNKKLRVFNIKHFDVETNQSNQLNNITKFAIANLQKLNPLYNNTNNELQVYYDLDGLNPINEAQKNQLYSTDPLKHEISKIIKSLDKNYCTCGKSFINKKEFNKHIYRERDLWS